MYSYLYIFIYPYVYIYIHACTCIYIYIQNMYTYLTIMHACADCAYEPRSSLDIYIYIHIYKKI